VSVSTHVLDSVLGRPAAGVAVRLLAGDAVVVAEGVTDADGRCRLTDEVTAAGAHRLVFATGPWFAAQDRPTFYPEVVLTFDVREPTEHHHVPLLLAPFAYSTYRGS
jgi:5-hydroxyisourate hydrolase